jgi:hypothetical protein
LDPGATGVTAINQLDFDNPDWGIYPSSFTGSGVCIGDINGDDLPDIFFTIPGKADRLYVQKKPFVFQDVTEQAGITDVNQWSTGATFADLNNDGHLDLYVCQYMAPNRLYLNRGDGTFEEKAREKGLDLVHASMAAAIADYDRDGRLDVYLLTYRLNDDNRVLHKAPIRKSENGLSVLPEFRELFQVFDRPDLGPGQFSVEKTGEFDHLFQQQTNGTFAASCERAGIETPGQGNAAIWWDYNNDGWLDLYVANDFFDADNLYRNNQDGTFTDVAEKVLPHTPWFSMGADTADLNEDGILDLLASDMAGSTHYRAKVSMGPMSNATWFLQQSNQCMRNALYLSTGTDRFREGAYLAGITATDWTWSVRFADMDSDGREDLFVANGMSRMWFHSDFQAKAVKILADHTTRRNAGADPATSIQQRNRELRNLYDRAPLQNDTNRAYRNRGQLHLEPSETAWGLDHTGISFGAAWADLDRDGDLDLITSNLNEPPSIYRNNTAGNNVLLRLVGTRSNRDGIGARVEARIGDRTLVRQHTLGRGFMSSDEPRVHFGLCDAARIDRLTIHWPSGTVQTLTDLPANRQYTITETGTPESIPQPPALLPLLDRNSSWIRWRHEENEDNEFARQPLLPETHGRLGPGLACADIDRDGDVDLYAGGAAGKPGVLLIHNGDELLAHDGPWREHAASEDLGSLWFDCDSDGDLDLYVVSGGCHENDGHSTYRDRIYLNQGNHTFTYEPERLPDSAHSSACIAAADFDGDRDLDLFVGGRIVPGRFPVSPVSMLLENRDGTFVDVTAQHAKSLTTPGMVSSATWSDVDNDGDPDLVIAIDYGAIRLFMNEDGTLTEQTGAWDLASRTGRWSSILGIDIDHDGDTDFIVGNLGLNTKYIATRENPYRVYYGNIDGKHRIIERTTEAGVAYPERGLSCSSDAIPSIKESFPTYEKFARAPLVDIYPKIDDLAHLDLTDLRSGILINEGNRFSFSPLPQAVQLAPVHGIAVTDLNLDGFLDVALVQNDVTPQPEAGSWDGGLGVILLGRMEGGLTPMRPGASGMDLATDGRSLVTAAFTGDRRPTLIAGISDAHPEAWISRATPAIPPVLIHLAGPAANPECVGARIRITPEGGTTRHFEVVAGGGYLSQNPPQVLMGRTSTATLHIEVEWPDGTQDSGKVGPIDHRIVIPWEPK